MFLRYKTREMLNTLMDRRVVLRFLNTMQIATALRPFRFAVHPDLFGKYPKEQAVNEESLKLFNEYIERTLSRQKTQPLSLTFYVKSSTITSDTHLETAIRPIHLKLQSSSVFEAIKAALVCCSLSLDYIESIQKSSIESGSYNINSNDVKDGHKFSDEIDIDINFFHGLHGASKRTGASYRGVINEPLSRQTLSRDTLNSWLLQNIESAQQRRLQLLPVQVEIQKLLSVLKSETGLAGIYWHNGWALTFFRTNLKRLLTICRQPLLRCSLKDRTIVFGNGSGVCVRGIIVLRYDDVPENWIRTLNIVSVEDEILQEKIVHVEKRLSLILDGADVTRLSSTNSLPPYVSVKEYYLQLSKLTDSLQDFKATKGRAADVHIDLTGLEIVVDCFTGSPIISQDGKILISAACPAFLIIDFINTKATEARSIKDKYRRLEVEYLSLLEQCRRVLKLQTLSHDCNVTREQMISCCSRMIQMCARSELQADLSSCQVNVSQFYSVMATGTLCIPWNFQNVL